MNKKEECKKNVINQLKRCEGQLRGIQRMVSEENGCKEVVTQLMAVKSSIDSVLGKVIANNLVECLINSPSDEDKLQEAINYVIKK